MNHKNTGVTVTDIANKTGFSQSTISRALNNSPKISEETKIIIREAALKIGYVNRVQETIRKNFNSHTIGFIVPSLVVEKYSILIESATDILEKKGYNVIISCSSGSSEKEQRIFQSFDLLNIQGIIGYLTCEKSINALLHKYSKKIPIVLFDHLNSKLPCDKISIDHFQIGYRACKYLLKNGRKRIAHLGGDKNGLLQHQISLGYRTAIKNSGLQIDDKLEFFSPTLIDDVTDFVDILINKERLPDAILVDEVLVSQKLISILEKKGLHIPDDISVMSICSKTIYSNCVFPISTITLPYNEVGKKAACMLLEQLNDEGRVHKDEVIVEPFLFSIRDSTR